MTLQLSDLGRALARGVVLVVAAALASCGGGESTTHFKASRVIAFGDETSLIVDPQGNGNGSKYGINAVVSAADFTIVCNLDLLWIQNVANLYGLVFPQCNPLDIVSPVSRIRATYGAGAADLASQIDTQLAESPFADGDLVTVLVGENDVIAQYAQYPMLSEAQISANLAAAGAEVGRQVNRLADLGAKVVVATIPDVGVTPFAVTEKANNIDTDRAALLTRLTQSFNTAMRSSLTNDGRRIGLVLFDEVISAIARNTGLDGFFVTNTGACDLNQSQLMPQSILDCNDYTLVEGASGLTYLWADDRHLSSGGQQTLGSLAVSRAQNNPF